MVEDRYIVTLHDSMVIDGIFGKAGRIDPSRRGCKDVGNTYASASRYPPLISMPRSRTFRSPLMKISYSWFTPDGGVDPSEMDPPRNIESHAMIPDWCSINRSKPWSCNCDGSFSQKTHRSRSNKDFFVGCSVVACEYRHSQGILAASRLVNAARSGSESWD